MSRWKTSLPWLLAFLFCIVPAQAEAATRSEAARRLEDYRRFFLDFQQAPDNAIPGELLADCHGIIMMKQYRAGFVFGGEYGGGVVMLHNRRTGDWSPPAFIRSAGGTWGLQIGGQQTDAIVLIMNQDGVNMLLNSRFTMGVDASAAVGPVGRNVAAAVGPGTALLTYSRARGLFAGATLGGDAMLNNDSMNRALYGMPITVRDIIDGRVRMPQEAYSLVDALNSYAQTNYVSPEYAPPPRPINPLPLERPGYQPDYQSGYSPDYLSHYAPGYPQNSQLPPVPDYTSSSTWERDPNLTPGYAQPPMQPYQGQYAEPYAEPYSGQSPSLSQPYVQQLGGQPDYDPYADPSYNPNGVGGY